MENEPKPFIMSVSSCTHFYQKVVVEETRAAHRLCPGVSLQGRGNLGHRLIGARAKFSLKRSSNAFGHLKKTPIGELKAIKLFSSNYIENLSRSEVQLNVRRFETFS